MLLSCSIFPQWRFSKKNNQQPTNTQLAFTLHSQPLVLVELVLVELVLVVLLDDTVVLVLVWVVELLPGIGRTGPRGANPPPAVWVEQPNPVLEKTPKAG